MLQPLLIFVLILLLFLIAFKSKHCHSSISSKSVSYIFGKFYNAFSIFRIGFWYSVCD